MNRARKVELPEWMVEHPAAGRAALLVWSPVFLLLMLFLSVFGENKGQTVEAAKWMLAAVFLPWENED